MKKLYQWLFDYSRLIKFKSNVPLDEGVRRLANITHVPSSRLVGQVLEKRVVLYQARPWVKLYYNPYFKGKFSREGNQVVLEGKFTVGRYGKIFTILCFVFLAILEVLSIFISLIPQAIVYSWIQLFVLITLIPFVIAMIICIILLIKRWSRTDVEWMSKKIATELYK